jgi:hypothetical protein
MVFVLVMLVMKDLISMLVVLIRECTMLLDTLVNVLLHISMVLCKRTSTLVVAKMDFTGKNLLLPVSWIVLIFLTLTQLVLFVHVMKIIS